MHADQLSRHQFATVDANNVQCTYGRHVYSGRFFASNEIKVLNVELLRRYDVVLGANRETIVPGTYKRPKTFKFAARGLRVCSVLHSTCSASSVHFFNCSFNSNPLRYTACSTASLSPSHALKPKPRTAPSKMATSYVISLLLRNIASISSAFPHRRQRILGPNHDTHQPSLLASSRCNTKPEDEWYTRNRDASFRCSNVAAKKLHTFPAGIRNSDESAVGLSNADLNSVIRSRFSAHSQLLRCTTSTE